MNEREEREIVVNETKDKSELISLSLFTDKRVALVLAITSLCQFLSHSSHVINDS